MKDYNSIMFRNGAIDRMNGKFGKGPGDGLKSKPEGQKSKRQIKKETNLQVAEIKGQQKIAQAKAKANMTPEQAAESKAKKIENATKFAKNVLETAATAATTIGMFKALKKD